MSFLPNSRGDARPSLLRRAWWPGWVAIAALAALYLLTLERDVTGSLHPYLFDVGQTQVVLNKWGTLHTTGYPLFALSGALLVTVQRAVGVNPATAASTVSLVWGLLTLGVLYDLLRRRTGRPWLAAVLVLVFGVMQNVWLFSIVAEVYTFFYLFVVLSLWVVLRDDHPWTRKDWLLLAGLLGLGAGHHRGIVFVLPTLVVLLWPRFWAARREMPLTLALGTLLAAATFLIYLYLPVRGWMGARWVDGDVTTWPGFLNRFFAREAAWMARPPTGLHDLQLNALHAFSLLADELTWVGLALGLVCLVVLVVVPGRGRLDAALALGFVVIVAFNIWLPDYVAVGAGLMPAPLFLLLAYAELAAYLAGRRGWLAWAAGLASTGLAAVLVLVNWPFVWAESHDPGGRALIEAVRQLDLSPADTLVIPGGPRFYALAFAQDVTGELAGLHLVNHNADLAATLDGGGRLITAAESFYVLAPPWWADALGGEVYLRSAGPDFVEIDDAPVTAVPPGQPVLLDNGVTLLASEIIRAGEGRILLTLYWMTEEPVDTAYSVFVHVVDGESGEMLAQADSYAPVSGWYPVTDWQPGEVVRDDHLVTLPDGYEGLLVLRAGMYRQRDDGSFENFEALSQPLTD